MKDKRWFQLLAVLPVLCLLIAVNVYIDPANVYHGGSEFMVEAMLDGQAVFTGSGNPDERAVKMKLVEAMPKQVECISIGPSLSVEIRREHVGTDSYFNLSASSLNYNEIVALFGLLELHEVEFDRVILCVDSYFFDESFFAGNETRKPEMLKYRDHMLSVLNGSPSPLADNIPGLELRDMVGVWKTKIAQALSVTYFQSAVELIQRNKSLIFVRRGIVDNSTEDFAHYVSDGSWVYASEYRNLTEEDVIDDAASYEIESMLSKGSHVSEQSKATFIQLVDYLDSKEVKVDLFLCPVAPSLWDRVKTDPEADQYYFLDELETFAKEVAAEKGLRIIGSYNPYNVGICDEDFYDARHIRHEKLGVYFDFAG